jgi:hypothetical protein
MTMIAPRPTGDGQRRPREDALPEHIAYRDEGCDLFASCLTCPLPRCRYDEPGGARTMLNIIRNREIRRLYENPRLNVDELAARFRVSRRTVFRVLQITRHPREAGHPSRRSSRSAWNEVHA